MGPINYSGMLEQFDVTPLLQGLQVGAQRRQARSLEQARRAEAIFAQQDAQRKQAEAAAYQADVAAVIANPTAEGYQALFLKHPQMREATAASLESYSDGQRTRNLDAAMNVAGLLQSGNTAGALDALKKRRAALEGKESTEITDSLIGMLESGDPEQAAKAKGLAGFVIASQLGDKAAPVLERLGFGGEAGQPKVLGYGDALVAPGGEVIYQAPDAPFTLNEGDRRFSSGVPSASGAPSSGGGGGTPRTQRLNNPGAIKDGAWAKSQPGYQGGDGTFAQFATPAAGAAAQRRLLGQNYLSKGFNTPSAIVNRYAPVGPENSQAQVQNYTNHIAKRLGIGPNDKITSDKLPALASAMAEFESGTVARPQRGGPAVVAEVPKPPKKAAPSETRSVNGKVYVKVEGSWYLQGAGQ